MNTEDLSDITLVTIGYNSEHALKEHYRSLELAKMSSDLRPRVLWIENCGTDNTENLISELYSGVEYHKSATNVGYGAGANIGIKLAQTRFVMVLNPDLLIEQEAITQLRDILKEREDAALIGPEVDGLEGSGLREVEWVKGAAMLFDTEKMGEIGYFDEDFFLYFEENDLCHRIKDAGKVILHSLDIKLRHLHGQSTQETQTLSMMYFLNWHSAKSYKTISKKHPLRYGSHYRYFMKQLRRYIIYSAYQNKRRKTQAKAKLHALLSKSKHPFTP